MKCVFIASFIASKYHTTRNASRTLIRHPLLFAFDDPRPPANSSSTHVPPKHHGAMCSSTTAQQQVQSYHPQVPRFQHQPRPRHHGWAQPPQDKSLKDAFQFELSRLEFNHPAEHLQVRQKMLCPTSRHREAVTLCSVGAASAPRGGTSSLCTTPEPRLHAAHGNTCLAVPT
jgi:hypothetical protein